MIRGTTPTHTFRLPFDTSMVDEVKITYAQDGDIKLVKGTEECVLEGSAVKVTLTQNDTFSFDVTKAVQVQIRILTISGEALASVIEKIGVADCLDNEVLE